MYITCNQYNAIYKWTGATKLDQVVDIYDKGDDYSFWDYEEDCELSFSEGMHILYDALAYPLIHDISEEEANHFFNVLKLCKLCNEEDREHITGISLHNSHRLAAAY